jgi:CTP synthase
MMVANNAIRPRHQRHHQRGRAGSSARSSRETQAVLVCVIGNFDPEDPGHSTVEPGLHRAASSANDLQVTWVSPESIVEDGVLDHLQDADAMFGAPGPTQAPDGYVDAIEFAREGQVPYLGCELGMDLAVVEFARRILTLPTAHSNEFDPEPRDAVVVELTPPELIKGKPTEIFGNQLVRFTKEGRLKGWMGAETGREEHRGRFGVNSKFKTPIVRAGLKIAATDETQLLVRALELADHPFFVLTSFAPQLRAENAGAHPLLKAFLDAIG